MKKTLTKKLTLSKETLKALSAALLSQVVGGILLDTDTCPLPPATDTC